jgi:hypothetical protein
MFVDYPQLLQSARFAGEHSFNLPRMKKSLLFVLVASNFLIHFPLAAQASDCIEKACIDVYTQDGKIVIEGRKGTGPVQKKAVAPAPTASRRAVVKKVAPPPKPKATGSAKPKILTATRKPVVKNRVVPKATASAQSLSDKLVEILPTAGIAYSPAFEPLIKVPVVFWCDIPPVITKKIEIVGEVVEVSLKPTFFWHYGDGVIFVTRKAGAPYPDGEIQHTYSHQGRYLVELITSWDGQFTVQGVTARIPGKIESVSILPITVVAAPTRFTPPVSFLRK